MDLNFDNSFSNELKDLGIAVTPAIPKDPRVVVFNEKLAQFLGFDVVNLKEKASEILSGKTLPLGAEPLALAYAGHQFGHFSPQLGDGRALLLGEVITPSGQRFDLAFKGSGPTPFARGGDGKAPLGPMLREYLVSEAMAALNIPTTRSLAVVSTGDTVWRNETLPGALLTRIAASHLRVGTFEFFAARQAHDVVKRLVDYSIDRHYPEKSGSKNPALALFDEVCAAQISLIAKWMSVGFVHGVMNTDNMTISGETIDYGPCAFMDTYDPDTVFSSIDKQGRYAYGNQPYILKWNLARFGESLLLAIDLDPQKSQKILTERIEQIDTLYKAEWLRLMQQKLGLSHLPSSNAEPMMITWISMLKVQQLDWTQSFYHLTLAAKDDDENIFKTFKGSPDFADWFSTWKKNLNSGSVSEMEGLNPIVIPRNHLVEDALSAASKDGDYSKFESLLAAVTRPYELPQDLAMTMPAPLKLGPYVTYCGT